MLKKVKNWHFSVLVGLASFLSLVFVQQYVLAQWQDPTYSPGTSVMNNILFNPLSGDLNLNGNRIMDTGLAIDPNGSTGLAITGQTIGLEATGTTWAGIFNGSVKVNGDLDVATVNGQVIGTNPWQAVTGGIYYNSGKVGIGTSEPNKLLHVKSSAGTNAEIDLQSGASTHWGIYQDESSQDLRFWYNDNRVVFSNTGRIGLGVTNPSYLLDAQTSNDTAVFGQTGDNTKYGLYGKNTASGGTAIYGEGSTGLSGAANMTGGMGVYGARASGSYAGYFNGTVRIINSSPTQIGYLHLSAINGNPPASDCNSTDHRGRMVFNYADHKLFVCDYNPVVGSDWRNIVPGMQ
jgi:hypothetical protein